MGKLAQDMLDYAVNSYDAKRFLSSGQTPFDSKLNMLEDSLTRVELELGGIDTSNAQPGALSGKSMDDGSSFQVPDVIHFDKMFREQEYADIDLLSKLQTTSTIPVGKIEQRFFIDDYVGEYKRAKASANDAPLVSLKGESYSVNVEMGYGAITWDQQEMDTATFSGRPLDMMRVRAIRRAYLENIYKLVIFGDDKLKGLMNGGIDIFQVADTVINPNSATGTAKKYWVNKTGREIVNDLTKARETIALATQSRWGGATAGLMNGVKGNSSSFTCLISQSAYYVLLRKFMTGEDGGSSLPLTAWEYLNTTNGKLATGITEYVIVHEFDKAFNSGTDSGFMLLPNSTEAYSFERPLGLTAKPVQFVDLMMKVPYYDYFAGLKLIRDKSIVGYRTIAAVS